MQTLWTKNGISQREKDVEWVGRVAKVVSVEIKYDGNKENGIDKENGLDRLDRLDGLDGLDGRDGVNVLNV